MPFRLRRVPQHLMVQATTIALPALAACGGGEPAVRTPAVSGDTIHVGVLTPLSDAVAVIGKPMLAGLTTYFDQVNAAGGVGGKYMVKLVAEDITYANPSSGSQKYQKIKDQVAMFGMIVGTDQVNGLLPLLAEDSVIALPTTFDAEWVRNPHLLPWGTPYQLQAINGVGYALTDGGLSADKVCTMTIATGYGEATVEGVNHLRSDEQCPILPRCPTALKRRFDLVRPKSRRSGAGVP